MFDRGRWWVFQESISWMALPWLLGEHRYDRLGNEADAEQSMADLLIAMRWKRRSRDDLPHK
jgi:hypothetical protein